MSTTMKRMMVSIPDDLALDLDKLKQKKYYNVPYSRMIQDVLRTGLQSSKAVKQDSDLKK